MELNGQHYCTECQLLIATAERKLTFLRPGSTKGKPHYLHFHEYDGRRCYTAYLGRRAHERNQLAHVT